MFRSTYGYGKIHPTESYWLAEPEWHPKQPSKMPLIWVHGAGTLTEGTMWTPQIMSLLHKLTPYFTVLAADLGDTGNSPGPTYVAWGNLAQIARIDLTVDWLRTYMGTTEKVTFIGQSMGGIGMLNYARVFPSKTRAVVGIIPALDMVDLLNNRTGFSYLGPPNYFAGPSAGEDMATTHNPVYFASTMDSTIPVLLMNATDDATTVPSTVTSFLSSRPQTFHQSLGAVGHTHEAVGVAEPYAIKFANLLTL